MDMVLEVMEVGVLIVMVEYKVVGYRVMVGAGVVNTMMMDHQNKEVVDNVVNMGRYRVDNNLELCNNFVVGQNIGTQFLVK